MQAILYKCQLLAGLPPVTSHFALSLLKLRSSNLFCDLGNECRVRLHRHRAARRWQRFVKTS
jgi:hypothetical protein